MACGFAPATPTAIHSITRAASENSLSIQSAFPTNPSASSEDQPKVLSFSGTDDQEHHSLVEELESILKSIPKEDPPGCEDIYGLDISIAWGSNDLQWCNAGPQGCNSFPSSVQPTEGDKKKFQRAVEIVNTLVGKAT